MASARGIILFLATLILLTFSLGFSTTAVKVTMYPGSNAYVQRTYTLAAPGLFTLEPKEIKGVLPYQISTVGEGVNLHFISQFKVNRTKQELKPLAELLNESIGKNITVKTSAGNYSAMLKWYDDSYIGIQDAVGLHIIALDSITDILIPGAAAMKDVNYTEKALSVFGSASRANSALTFGYVKRDLSWSIDYDLVIANGQGTLTQYSTISNNGDEEYKDADVTLSMLNPNFAGSAYGRYYGYDYMVKASVVDSIYGTAPSPTSPVFTPTSGGGIWSYRPSTPITLVPYSSHKMVLFTGAAAYTKKYVWDIRMGQMVYRVYELNNTRKEVLPSGTVHVFDSGTFVGEDTIDMLGSKSSKELYVANVPHIEVEKIVLSDEVAGSSITKFIHTVKVQLKIRNRDDTKSEIEVREDLSGYSDLKYLKFSIQPYKVEGGKAYWKIPVNAGEEQVVEYSYTYSGGI